MRNALRQQDEAARRSEQVWRISDSQAFRANAFPAISVIITLYNYERFISQCVASLEWADCAAIPGRIEILSLMTLRPTDP
ncbi:MAG: hypothetical protein ACREIF_10680 [Chthoniobacterales bacterium]